MLPISFRENILISFLFNNCYGYILKLPVYREHIYFVLDLPVFFHLLHEDLSSFVGFCVLRNIKLSAPKLLTKPCIYNIIFTSIADASELAIDVSI